MSVRLGPEGMVFVTERHLGTLTTLRADGSPHVVPVGFTWDQEAGLVRVTARRTSVKVRNAARRHPDGSPARAAVCQVDGGRWMTLEGTATVSEDPDEIADAVRRYAQRYRPLDPQDERVLIRIAVDKVMASDYMSH